MNDFQNAVLLSLKALLQMVKSIMDDDQSKKAIGRNAYNTAIDEVNRILREES